ncbi:ABC transporter substrate-binding protein [Thalassospira marina]|uniref:Sugar ABC transporter substrate-binding protein n=1 Tax=Thalassospira marina TaxID=2048283 RepID=A0A2N3KZW5_9PROT|nr:ABC transporter substrate-binding protein [Thalassospira marina]PKR56115.1 sugar ABC transporter substrate-binding protein [Thalassospira marina]
MVLRTIGALLTGVILSAGCGQALAETAHMPRVAFINPGFGSKGFWKDVSETMHAAAKQFGFEIVEFDSDRQWPLMAQNANRVFAMDPPPDYIIASNEHQQGGRIIIEANTRHIPIFMLLNDLTDEQKARLGHAGGKKLPYWIATLTPDNKKAGYDIARSLVVADEKLHPDETDRDICLLSLTGDWNTPASLDRIAGLDLALADFPVLDEKRRLVANWSYDEAYKRTAGWLPEGCLDAVWAANDDIARGAIAAIEDTGKVAGKDVVVGGLNWSAQGLKLVKEGKMTMTHGGHFLAGAWIMVMLNDFHNGVDLQGKGPNYSFPMQAITRDNVDLFQEKFGKRDWNIVDFTSFSLSGREQDDATYQFDLKHLFAAIKPDR